MADRGFEPNAMIRHNRRSSYLELTIREMRAMSWLERAEPVRSSGCAEISVS